LSDAIQVPDLRPRSLAFLRYDFWRKLRRRERWTKADAGLFAYGVLGIAFMVFSLWLSYFFWKRLFFKVIAHMWNSGVIGKVLLLILGAFIGGPIVRGLIKVVRSLVRITRAAWDRIRFRSQRRWRVEAARLVDALPVFSDLPEETLSEIAGRFALRSFGAGQPLVRQGEPARAYYVVRRGTLDVIEETADGLGRVLRTLGRGDAFGELGLVDRAPRTATVRGATAGQVFELDAGSFQRALEQIIALGRFAPTSAELEELRGLGPFRHLEVDALLRLLERGKWMNITAGTSVVEQGEVADAFYTIGSGQVEVLEDGERVRALGPGAWFGEVALLQDVRRTATVRTLTPVRVFRLDREGFDRLVRESPGPVGTERPVAAREQSH